MLMHIKELFPGLSIKVKLLGLLMSLVLILISSGVYLQSSLNDSARYIDRQSRLIENLRETTSAGKNYSKLRYQYVYFMNNPSPSSAENLLRRIDSFEESVTVLSDNRFNEIQELKFSLHKLSRLVNEIAHIEENTLENVNPLYTSSYRLLTRIDEILSELKNSFEVRLDNLSYETLEHTRGLLDIPFFFLIGGLLTLFIAAVIVIFDVFMPVRRITHAMALAANDTDNADKYVLQPPSRQDEIGKAALELNHLLYEVSWGIDKIRDTEKRLRETGKYLQAIMDNVVDGLVILNEQGVIKTFSPSAEKIFGYEASSVVGENAAHIIVNAKGEDSRNIFETGFFKKLADKPPIEFETCRNNGKCISVELAIGKTRYAGKNYYIITVRDITSRKQMENFLEHAQRMETIGRMTGGIAHDFNNMLTVISGNLEILERKLKDNELMHDLVITALESIDRGTDLTQRLLAFSRKQLLKPELVNINERLPDIISLIQKVIREDIKLKVKRADDLWLCRVDPLQLENAMINLAINAKDAIPGSGTVTLETSSLYIDNEKEDLFPPDISSGSYVVISVTDDGQGIEKEVLDHVFEPFFTTKDVGKGTGLGLSMVYGFTRQSGGFVKIYSEPGKGTTVKLYFPKAYQDILEGEAFTGAEPEATGRSRDFIQEPGKEALQGTESIMIVEDETDLLKYLTSILKELGYKVTQAKDGETALKLLSKRKKLDLLLTDVVMPGSINGEALASKVQKKIPGVKILFMSGYTKDALVDQGNLREGVNLISKPFTRSQIAKKIREVLEN